MNSHVLITWLQLMTNLVSFISYPVPPPKLFASTRRIISPISISVSLNKDFYITTKHNHIIMVMPKKINNS